MSDKLKISLKETWQSTLRMLKTISRADKGLLPTMLLYQALTALTPYVAIFFSARLLSELSGARDPAKLRFWVLASLISALVLAILIGLARAMAKELGPSGIRVNCVAPGVIDTPMMDEYSEETKKQLAEETPLMRIGSPKEVANACVFLLSEEAGYVTGQVLGVDGGYL